MNTETKRRVKEALKAAGGGSDEVAIIDLIADLLHYSDHKKFDIERVIYWGIEHYRQETMK